jgi:CTP:molybdopterin cytidylyltransferase MocA
MIAGVVLAAGAGRRFGGAKQLALVDGEPLVRRACRLALAAELEPVLVVLGHHAEEVAAAIADLGVRTVVNPRPDEGMGSSVACAARALAADPAVTALAILLADQPDIEPAHVRALGAHVDAGAPVAATRHGDAVGAPAVFARAMFGALAALSGDRGARDLIAACDARVEVALEAAARDVDTPADLSSRRA